MRLGLNEDVAAASRKRDRRRLSNSALIACNDNCELARIGGLDRHGFLLSVERRIAFGGLVRRFERVMCFATESR